jgi:hypothetical protein
MGMSDLRRARERVRYCETELARFESYATAAEPDQLTLCKLARDLLLAEADIVAAKSSDGH